MIQLKTSSQQLKHAQQKTEKLLKKKTAIYIVTDKYFSGLIFKVNGSTFMGSISDTFIFASLLRSKFFLSRANPVLQKLCPPAIGWLVVLGLTAL